MRALSIAALLALIAACSSTQVSMSEAIEVAPVRYQLFRERMPGRVAVMITRDNGFIGRECPTSIAVNGHLAVSLRPGEKATLHIPAGEVIFGADAGMCGGGLSELGVALLSGHTTYLRISADQSGAMRLEKTVAR
ncbi:MAG: hypothetical protein ABIS45_07880 [Burkholderiales bacterium]